MVNCQGCNTDKDDNAFRWRILKDGTRRRRTTCRVCEGKRRPWHLRNVAARLIAEARKRAKECRCACAIVLSDIVVPTHCPVLGLKLAPARGVVAHNSPTIDRIDPRRGYVPRNVWVISHRANSMKGGMTLDDLLHLAKVLRKAYQKAGFLGRKSQA